MHSKGANTLLVVFSPPDTHFRGKPKTLTKRGTYEETKNEAKSFKKTVQKEHRHPQAQFSKPSRHARWNQTIKKKALYMRCIRPINARKNLSGDIVYNNPLSSSTQQFQFECRKCLPCRLNIAREKAIRCVHEAKMHEDNIFLTLTYNDASLESPWLQYEDFQKFIKKLREDTARRFMAYANEGDGPKITIKEARNITKVTYMVTGEYGEKTKRPHWHAIIFNYRPTDATKKYTTEQGEQVYHSEEIETLWGKGNTEFGSVTMESAGYVARYAAKKLVHGKDQDHPYQPIHKTSSKHAIGKKWLEKYWRRTFEQGNIMLPDGQVLKIPRYYVSWLKKNKPLHYVKYVHNVQKEIIAKAEEKNRKEELTHIGDLINRSRFATPETRKIRAEARKTVKLRVLETKFKQLQERLKI